MSVDQLAAFFLLLSLICLLAAMLGWPLTPDWITWILLPDSRKSLVCSAMDSEVSTAGFGTYGLEPANETTEIGVQLFWMF